MIDSHCHLDREPLINNFNDIIKRAKDVGIEKILTICTTKKNFENIEELIQKDKIIYGTFGIHPHETSHNQINKLQIINNVKKNPKIIGVGETGLDFYYNNSDKNSQIKSFEEHIQASIELNVPIIIHSRSAEYETFEILNKYKNKNLKILMHCFTGSQHFVKKLIELNSYFSASGIITFKKSAELNDTFKIIPLEKILIETDSPFLAPIPKRGKSNEPSYLKYTLEHMAKLKNIPSKEMEILTTKNFNKLFEIIDED
mgnify:CR=1 FL=1|tara:strand:+ start:10464 stop:11237 length:774 start_codon:yes stop_codon:yes gene_type:complete